MNHISMSVNESFTGAIFKIKSDARLGLTCQKNK